MTIPDSPPSPPSTRNIAWIVIVSLLAAILLAIVLVLVVFGGARELPPGPDRDNALQLIGRFRVQIATLQSRLRTLLEAGRPITSLAA